MSANSVEVLFDYQYDTPEGKLVSIHKGDIYTLLDKSTEEWWKVRKDSKEKFYVPASYVRVNSKPVAVGASDSISIHTDIPSIPVNGHHRNISNGSSGADSYSDSQSNSESLDSKGETLDHVSSLQMQSSTSSTNGSDINTAPMLSLHLQPTITVTSDGGTPSPSPEEPEATYENLRIIQEIIAQRRENNNIEPLHSNEDDWQKLKDDESGKAYYFNPVTNETTWDSPVIRRKNQLNSSNAPAMSPRSKRLSRVTSFRKGWTETVADDGSKVYVHNATGEKWHMTIDSSGKEYYYKENSQESLWELPEGGYTLRNAAQSSNAFDTQKRGYLFKAKFSEGKKKVKKNWCLSYLVAFDHLLLVYKDEKAALPKPDAELGKPETMVDLKQATIDWAAKERSNRKNVLEISLSNGSGYLLQHEDNMLIHQWLKVIQGKVRKFNPSMDGIPEEGSSPETEGSGGVELRSSTLPTSSKLKHSRRLSKYSGSKSVYTFQEDNTEFQVPTGLGPAGEVTAKTSIKNKLRKFLTRRPTQESLEKQGILQVERVFGSRLQFICDRESTTVPKFVVRCLKTIERKGLDFDGLYRINGNLAQIQKLRLHIDQSDDYNLADYDVNVLTGSLKLFFRELKEPLIPFHLYNILSDTIRDKDLARKARTMKLQLATMPTVNLDTLKFLFSHLVRVHEHVDQNRMRPQNIAIVFGPTLMWPEKESSAIAVSMMCQNSIVEYILLHFDKLF